MLPGAGILTIIIALAGAIAAPFLRHVFELRKEKKYREMAGSLFWGLLPFGAASLVWTAIGDSPMAWNNLLLGVVGAAIGAAGFIFLGYVVSDQRAAAQSSQVSSGGSPPNNSTSMAQRSAYAAAFRERAYKNYTEYLADPSYSAETKLVISHKRDMLPLLTEYDEELSRDPSLGLWKSPKAVAFFNKRLRETGKDWQITPENVDATFGDISLNTRVTGPGTGIEIIGGSGNTFDQTDIKGSTKSGIKLQETHNNQFSNTRIGPADEPTK
jgi:hypothetical protein